MDINFTTTDEDAALILDVVDRAERAGYSRAGERISTVMDITACHCNGTPLDLDRLLHDFDDFNFAHDVLGIRRHLDRETGKLMNCFLPRCTLPHTQEQEA